MTVMSLIERCDVYEKECDSNFFSGSNLKDEWAKINNESFKWKQFNGRSLTHISPVHI